MKLRRAIVVCCLPRGSPPRLLKATENHVRDVIHAFERGFDALDPTGAGRAETDR